MIAGSLKQGGNFLFCTGAIVLADLRCEDFQGNLGADCCVPFILGDPFFCEDIMIAVNIVIFKVSEQGCCGPD